MGNYVGQSDHENTAGCTAVQQSTVVQPAVSGQTHLLSLLPLTPADLHQASTDYLQPDRELTGHQQNIISKHS